MFTISYTFCYNRRLIVNQVSQLFGPAALHVFILTPQKYNSKAHEWSSRFLAVSFVYSEIFLSHSGASLSNYFTDECHWDLISMKHSFENILNSAVPPTICYTIPRHLIKRNRYDCQTFHIYFFSLKRHYYTFASAGFNSVTTHC